MESSLVIKVKYGQTLRRFNAYLLPGNDKLDLDMDGLRAKICSLFSFAPDADLKMTYIDEDGDEVTLVDDDDLFDAIRQRLKFLRIDVRLSNERSSKTSVQSSGISTPPRSPQTENRFPNINAGVAEILKPLPEPVHEAFSKLCSDISSKVALSNPTIADIVESLVHLGNSYRNSDSQPPTGAESSTQNVPFESPMPPSVTNSKPLKDDDYPVASPRSKLAEVPSKNIQEVNSENLTESLGNKAKVMFSPNHVDLNVRPTVSKESECVMLNLEPSASNTTSGMKKEEKEKETTPCFLSGIHGSDAVFTRMGDTEREYPNECPYSGVPVAGDIPFLPIPPIPHGHIYPAKRSFSRCADLGTVFHRGVICDGCGVHPITGPRFKSKVKEDFDLCCMCFAEIGNVDDYVRMDHPIHHRHSRSFRGLHNQRLGPPIIPRILKGCGAKAGRHKLESRFIMDVNVLDGTIMAPCTPFTKIWRMRNNGTLDWPKGTQLLWIGGDKFSHAISVEIETSAAGCIPVDKEVDIAVDFIAPELPGRYISYWRMGAPSGQKFGQRVWVLIQVDASLGRTLSASLQDLNLNLPPLSGVGNGPKTIDMNVEPCENNSFLQAIPVKPADEVPKRESEMYFPIDDTLLVGQSFPCPTAPTAPASSSAVPTVLGDQKLTVPTAPESSSAVSYPAADGDKKFPVSISQITPLMYPIIDVSMPSPIIVTPPPTEDNIANKELEESLLKELEEMGFKQVDLNKEVLRINEYNLEQSVDDLCGVSEWDPILDELEEMGFGDKVMNKKLLVKNNGSIKHVVMDLISGEKA